MQSRSVREGSVGLMLLAGLGVFGGIFLWLKGLTPGNQSYSIIAQFPQAPGIQPGGVVRFRGIRVGKIVKIEPGVNGVDVVMQMDDPSLTIPKDVIIAVSQTGLIGEPVVEITPRSAMTIDPSKIAKALDTNCDRTLILCNNTKVNGEMGANFNQLLERATKLIDLYTNPELVKNLNNTLVKAGTAAEDFSRLSKSLDRLSGEFSSLPKSVEKGLNNLTVNANTITASLDRTSQKIGTTADKFGTTADKLGRTTDEFNLTAVEYKKLAISVNSLVAENKKTFASSLKNFDLLTVDLRRTTNSLTPTINKLNSTVAKVNSDKLVKDLQDLLSNANQTAINLKSVTASLNDPKTLLILQQTLDSARITFQNTQKITADIDEITGSPEFRANFKNLVNGLGKLVSSTEQLEQQVKLAQTIEPLSQSLKNPIQLSNPTRYSFRPIVPANLSTFPAGNQPTAESQILDRDPLPERILPPKPIVSGKSPASSATDTVVKPLPKGKLLPIRRQKKTPSPSPETEP
jgi:phospholipid/cholesterol/gamma-HCH transport system substrate-binding protein